VPARHEGQDPRDVEWAQMPSHDLRVLRQIDPAFVRARGHAQPAADVHLDDPMPRESGQRPVAGLDRGSSRDHEHELDPVGDRLRGQVADGGLNRRPAFGGEHDRGEDRVAHGTSRVVV